MIPYNLRVVKVFISQCISNIQTDIVLIIKIGLAENVNKPHPFQLFVLEPDGLLLSAYSCRE